MSENLDYKEFRRIPILGLEAEYQISRAGKVVIAGGSSQIPAGKGLTPSAGFGYALRIDGDKHVYNVNYLLDRAFPEDGDRLRALQHPKTGLWHEFYLRVDAQRGQVGAWRLRTPPGQAGTVSLDAQELIVRQQGHRVISGSDYLEEKRRNEARRQEALAEKREQEKRRERFLGSLNSPERMAELQRGAAAPETPEESSVPFDGPDESNVPFEIPKEVHDDLNAIERLHGLPPKLGHTGESPIADPLLTLTEAVASLSRSIEMLIKNRSGQ